MGAGGASKLALEKQNIHQAPEKHDGDANGALNKHAVNHYAKCKERPIQRKNCKPPMEVAAKEVKFAADRMLGKLAKWLRIMGQDVIYGQHLSGYGLIHTARMEHRLILTRDRKLKRKQPPDFLFIESDHYREQLRQVIQACGLAL